MRFAFFSIPTHGGERAKELDQFLGSHQIAHVDRQLVVDGTASFWAVCVSFVAGPRQVPSATETSNRARASVDYREVLPPDEFAVFIQLRALRKSIADREGVPLYHVFSNEQLAEMIRQRVTTRAELARIHGVGEKRIEQFGEEVLTHLRAITGSLGLPLAARDGKEGSDATAEPRAPG